MPDDPGRRATTPHCWRLDSARAIELAGLQARRHAIAGATSHGEQRQLEIGVCRRAGLLGKARDLAVPVHTDQDTPAGGVGERG